MYCTGGIRCEKASAYFKHKGFENVYQLEGGIIEYARQIKAEGLESKFIGKNFVFDHRLGERITDDVVSQCHQCGAPCDVHTNCANEGCHLLFIQCENCAAQMQGCCSVECSDVINLPEDEQKTIRKGIMNGNKIFKKGKSDKLIFKNTPDAPIAKAIATENKKIVSIKIKKNYIGKAMHYFVKAGIGQFLIESDTVSVGDKIMIQGPTTGIKEMVVTEMHVNDKLSDSAMKGDVCTFKIPFRIRLSDKLYNLEA
jgi:UPF0176 protein